MAESTSLPNRRAPVLGGQPLGGKDGKAPEPSAQTAAAAPEAKKGWRSKLPPLPSRFVIWVCLICSGCLFLVGLTWGAIDYLKTDSGVRHFLLPYLAKKLGLKPEEITAELIVWDPFVSVKFKNLKVGPNGNPFFKAKQLTIRYSGWDVIKNNYAIDSVIMVEPVIKILESGDGKLNGIPEWWGASIEKFIKSQPQLTIGKLDVQKLDATVRTHGAELRLNNFEIKTQNLRSKATLTFDVISDFTYKLSEGGIVLLGEKNVPFRGHLKSKVIIEIDSMLRAKTASVGFYLTSLGGNLGAVDLEGAKADGTIDINALKDKLLAFTISRTALKKDDELLVEFKSHGTWDQQKDVFDFDLETSPMKDNLLGPYFTPLGLNLQTSTASLSGHAIYEMKPNKLHFDGKASMSLSHFSTPKFALKMPKPLYVDAYHVTDIEFDSHFAQVKSLKLNLTYADRSLLKTTLNKIFKINWSTEENSELVHEPIDFDFQLAPSEWTTLKPFLPEFSKFNVEKGVIEGAGKVTIEKWGDELNFAPAFSLSHAKLKTNWADLDDAEILYEGKFQLSGLKTLKLEPSALKVRDSNRSILVSTISAIYDHASGKNVGNIQFHCATPEVFARLTEPFNISNGAITGVMSWNQKSGDEYGLDIECEGSKLNLGYGNLTYENVGVRAKGKLDWDAPVLKIAGLKADLLQAEKPCGSVEGDLEWNQLKKDALVAYSVKNLKPEVFAPFVSSKFSGVNISSLDLTSSGQIIGTNGAFKMMSTNEVKNLAFTVDGNKVGGKGGFATKVVTDFTYNDNGQVDIRTLNAYFEPASAVRNMIKTSGTIRRTSNELIANLDVVGKSLDLTPFHDQFFPLLTKAMGSKPLFSQWDEFWKVKERDVKVNVKMDSLRIHQLTLSDIDVPFHLMNRTYELLNAKVRYSGAPVTMTFTSDLKGANRQLRFAGKVDGLAVKSAGEWFPGLNDSVGGTISLKTYGTAKGNDIQTLKKNMIAVFEDFSLNKSHLEKMPFIGETLKQLSTLLRSPTLSDVVLSEADSTVEVTTSGQVIRNLVVSGPNLKLSLQGVVLSDKKVKMEGTFNLRREAVNRSILAPYTQVVKGPWIEIPEKLKIDGTLDRPQVRLNVTNILKKVPPTLPPPPGPQPPAPPAAASPLASVGNNPL